MFRSVCGFHRPSFFIFFLFFYSLVFVPPAFAQTREVEEAIAESADKSIDVEKQENKETIRVLKSEIDRVVEGMITRAAEEKRVQAPDPDYPVMGAFEGFPAGLALQQMTADSFLHARLLELNLVAPKPDKNGKQPYYLIDPTQKSDQASVRAEMLDVYMRLFCDPRARGGTMSLLGRNPNDPSYILPFTTKYKDGSHNLACGALQKGKSVDASVPSRETLIGPFPMAAWNKSSAQRSAQEKAAIAQQEDVIGLPQNPGRLFFYPETFPVMPLTQMNDTTNTHKMAPVWTGALAMALQFLAGEPAGKFSMGTLGTESGAKAYIAYQANIARKMLASYVFTQLFSERVGTLNQDVAEQVSDIVLSKLGPAGSNEELYQRAMALGKRANLSVAEYQYILMHEMMLSPGYLDRLNELNADNLVREQAILNAWQVALMQQINHWLQVLAALEAVKREEGSA
jgi:hypothetical protein